MTVQDLVKELLRMPQDKEVALEGCDCHGDAASVELETWQGTETGRVLICRPEDS